jgi:hypothetical protein
VHAIEDAGAVATCNPTGAGKWRDEFTELIAHAPSVRVIADRDEEGRRHAAAVASSLFRAGVADVVTLEPAVGKDAAEHLTGGQTLEDLVPADLSQSSRPDRDAVGTRSAATPAETGGTAIASPRPDVVGTRDGTQSFSTGAVSVDLEFEDVATFADENEEGAAPLLGDDDEILIAEDADVMSYGDGGAGKTTLMNDLALHLAAGDAWLGVPAGRACGVGIVENEGPRPLFRKKLRRKIRGWTGSDIGGRLLMLKDPWGGVALDKEQVRVALAAAIAEHELDVVFIGPVTRSGMNDAGTLQQVVEYTKLLADVRIRSGRRVTFVLVHHENRAGQVSGAWEGAVDTLFHVQAQGHGQTRLFIQKARWGGAYHKQKLQLVWTEGGGFDVTDEEERDDNAVADEILEFVLNHGGTGWNKVDQAVAGKGDRLRTIRDGLLDGGRLVNRGSDARMKLWHLDDPALPVEAA